MRLKKYNMKNISRKYGSLFLSILTITFILTCLSWSSYAVDSYVSKTGSDTEGDGSSSSPYLSITKAVEESFGATEGNPARIRIASGWYYELLNLTEYIHLYGGYNETDWSRNVSSNETRIISMDNRNTVLKVNTGSVLDGLSFRGGGVGVDCGNFSPTISNCLFLETSIAAVMINGDEASPLISGCSFEDNKEGIYASRAMYPVIMNNNIQNGTGNGVTIQNGDVVILKNNVIRENALSGINISYCTSPTLEQNVILRNNHYGIRISGSATDILNNVIAYQGAAGIFCRYISSGLIAHNSLYLNGNGMALDSASPEIVNNISFYNYHYGIIEYYPNSYPALKNNCLSGNGQANYLDGGTTPSFTTADFSVKIDNGGEPVTGNFAENPKYADVSHENFHLLPDSPCIGAGTPLQRVPLDFEGDERGAGVCDVGCDEYLSRYYCDFENGDDNWHCTTIPGFATPPDYSSSGGNLMLRCKDGNTYGFWESDPSDMPVFENMIYRGRWSIRTDEPNQSLVPAMRYRFNESDFQMSVETLIASQLDGVASPVPEGRDYELYYRPLQGSSYKTEKAGNMIAAFDLVNFGGGDSETAALFLDELEIEWINLNMMKDDFTTRVIYTFDEGKEGWTQGGATPDFSDDPQDVSGPGYLALKSVSDRCYGFFQSPLLDATQNTLYRIRFHVGASISDREKVPQVRFRLNTSNNQVGTVVAVSSNGNGDSSPMNVEFTPYELYCVLPEGAESAGFHLAMDLVNLSDRDDPFTTIYLNTVEVHSIPLPLF